MDVETEIYLALRNQFRADAAKAWQLLHRWGEQGLSPEQMDSVEGRLREEAKALLRRQIERSAADAVIANIRAERR